jgi:hypothetical protein
MGCIRVDKILDHICEPLRKCLQDDNPYVRKTAAIGVAKLWDLDQERAVENGFVTILQELVSDSNPMVIDTGPSCILASFRRKFSAWGVMIFDTVLTRSVHLNTFTIGCR